MLDTFVPPPKKTFSRCWLRQAQGQSAENTVEGYQMSWKDKTFISCWLTSAGGR